MMGRVPKLDRRLGLTIRGEGRRDVPGQEGLHVAGAPTFDGTVWAKYAGRMSEPELTEGGMQVEASQRFCVRYRVDLASIGDTVSRVTVVDDGGREWVVSSVREMAEPRRRYMELVCIREDPTR